MKFSNFKYLAPATLDDAVQLLVDGGGDAKIIAGGQSLLPTMAFRLAQPSVLIDLRRMRELRHITVEDDHIRIGALTRWVDIERNESIRRELPILAAAMPHIAHYQIRNRGTIGGSLAHADPAAEMPCLALTCGATILARGEGGERVIPIENFFLGSLTTALASDEILVEIRFPRWTSRTRWAFREFARRAGDFAMAGLVVLYDLDAEQRMTALRLGAFGVGATPMRLRRAEAVLEGQRPSHEIFLAAAAEAAQEIDPSDDAHISAAYRRSLLSTLFVRALTESVR